MSDLFKEIMWGILIVLCGWIFAMGLGYVIFVKLLGWKHLVS